MKNNNSQTVQLNGKIQVRFIKGKDLLVMKDESGNTMLVSANLIRHTLGIPYTKKDGTQVTLKQIQASHRKSRLAYARAIEASTQSKKKG